MSDAAGMVVTEMNTPSRVLVRAWVLDLARETYLNAWIAALFAGRLADSGDMLEVCRAARALPACAEPRTVDLALDGLSLIMTDGAAAAAFSPSRPMRRRRRPSTGTATARVWRTWSATPNTAPRYGTYPPGTRR